MKRILALLLLLANMDSQKLVSASDVDLTDLYLQVYNSYIVFPPLGTAEEWKTGEIDPIDVSVINLLQSVDEISPGESKFTVTVRTAQYWNQEACNLTTAHQYACDNPVGNLHFIAPDTAPSTPCILKRCTRKT
jgi:hypothetical protein